MRTADGDLWSLLSSGESGCFDQFRALLGAQLAQLDEVMRGVARKRAPDLDADDVVSETYKRVIETLFTQFVGGYVSFRFDPALAPFEAYVFKVMGGAETRGVIDTLRTKKRRTEARNVTLLDEHLRKAEAAAVSPPDQGGAGLALEELLAPLTPRENLVLRLEIGLDAGSGADLRSLRAAVQAAGFNSADETDIMERALRAGIPGSVIRQTGIAALLKITPRQVRNLKNRALKKIRNKFFPGIQIASERKIPALDRSTKLASF